MTRNLTIALVAATALFQANAAHAATATCTVYSGSNQTGTSVSRSASCAASDGDSCSNSTGIVSLADTDLNNNVSSARVNADNGNDDVTKATINFYNWIGTGFISSRSTRSDDEITINFSTSSGSLFSSFECTIDSDDDT